jgi:hypothetical protein
MKLQDQRQVTCTEGEEIKSGHIPNHLPRTRDKLIDIEGNTTLLIFNLDLGQPGLSGASAFLYGLNPFIYEGLDAFEKFNPCVVHVFKEWGFSIHHVPEAPYSQAHRANEVFIFFA